MRAAFPRLPALRSPDPAMPGLAPEAESRSKVIGYRKPKRARLIPLLILSIALHLALALIVTTVLSRHFAKEPEVPTDAMDITLGQDVQEAIAPADAAPAPPDPTPPPPTPEPPPPEPPPEPPPVAKEPDFVEPKPPPKPPAPRKEAPKAPPKPAAAPAGAKVGPKPQAGVVGGNVTQGATTGTPGGPKVGKQVVRRPTPPYPHSALVSHIPPPSGGRARVSYDATGNVKSCETMGLSSPFDSDARNFIRANWKGIPNSSETFPVIYRLQ